MVIGINVMSNINECKPELNIFSSKHYWEQRYTKGGNSGAGSYKHLAEFKAEVLNSFVRLNCVKSVIEFGCGDGNQLRLAEYPEYTGYDVSKSAVDLCRRIHEDDATKFFKRVNEYDSQKADLSISLDVIYHLIESEVYDDYMTRLFDSSKKFVIIYSSNTDQQFEQRVPHFLQRKFTDWVEANKPNWTLIQHIPNKFPFEDDCINGSVSDFYIYEKV